MVLSEAYRKGADPVSLRATQYEPKIMGSLTSGPQHRTPNLSQQPGVVIPLRSCLVWQNLADKVGCFYKLGVLFEGVLKQKEPYCTIWGLYLGLLNLALLHYLGSLFRAPEFFGNSQWDVAGDLGDGSRCRLDASEKFVVGRWTDRR